MSSSESSAFSAPSSAPPPPTRAAGPAPRPLVTLLSPLLVFAVIAALPAPAGLAQHAWYYVAIFAAVIVGLIVEPIPAAAVGLMGVVTVAALAQFVLLSPDQLATPGFNATGAAIS